MSDFVTDLIQLVGRGETQAAFRLRAKRQDEEFQMLAIRTLQAGQPWARDLVGFLYKLLLIVKPTVLRNHLIL